VCRKGIVEEPLRAHTGRARAVGAIGPPAAADARDAITAREGSNSIPAIRPALASIRLPITLMLA
jgi:hypothetical protein